MTVHNSNICHQHLIYCFKMAIILKHIFLFKQASEMVAQYRDDLTEHTASSMVYAKTFLLLVNVFRNAKKDDVLMLLKKEENEEIV